MINRGDRQWVASIWIRDVLEREPRTKGSERFNAAVNKKEPGMYIVRSQCARQDQ